LKPANDAVRRIASECEANGLIFQTRGVRDLHNVIRLVPPMTSSDAEVDRAMSILGDAIAHAAKAPRRRK
jgi:4-aminobutyrate aminotransferase-like enzyme